MSEASEQIAIQLASASTVKGLWSGIIINVRDYGAVGDGVTDDTTAIQDAIDAAPYGAIILFPMTTVGIYKITLDLELKTGTILMGATRSVTIKQFTAGVSHIANTDINNFGIINLTFHGNSTGGGLVFTLSSNTNIQGFHMERITITNIGGGNNGITLQVPILSTLTDVLVRHVTSGHGFALYGGGTTTVMTTCYASDCGQAGFFIQHNYYSKLIACAADYCGIGFYVNNSTSITLDSCGTEENINRVSAPYTGVGFHIGGGYGNVLNGCYSRADEKYGVYFGEGDDGAVAAGSHTLIGFRQKNGSPVTTLFGIIVDTVSSPVTIIGYDTEQTNSFAKTKTHIVSLAKDSIASAPTFIGQNAVVSGIVYIAKDTTSTSDWLRVSNHTDNGGTSLFSGNGSNTAFTIPHGLGTTPTFYPVTAGSSDAKGDFYVTANSTNIIVTYGTAPGSGTNNVSLTWFARV